MIYYINVFLEIVVGAIILYGVYDNSALFSQKAMSLTRRKIYCIFSGVLWILISGLRSLSVGADTDSYYISYNTVKNISLSELVDNVYGRYILHQDIRDPGYNLFVKLTQIITEDYQVFLMIIAIIFMVPFIIWIIRESKNPIISFVLYSSLFYAFFSITGIRQTIATAMVVLIGDKLIKDKKFVAFMIICLLASTIHFSALIFFSFYFLSRIPVTQKSICGWTFAIVLAFIFRNQLKTVFIDLSGYTDYTEAYEGAGTFTFTTLLVALFILSIMSYKRDHDLNKNNRFYVALFLALFFVPLTWINPSAMRIVQYFSIYLVLLIPEMIESVFDEKSKRIVTIMAGGLLVILLIRSHPSYSFFWQDSILR